MSVTHITTEGYETVWVCTVAGSHIDVQRLPPPASTRWYQRHCGLGRVVTRHSMGMCVVVELAPHHELGGSGSASLWLAAQEIWYWPLPG